MFKELQSVVGDSSAFTMCLAVYVQVPLARTSLQSFGGEISETLLCPQFDPSVLERDDLLDIFLFYSTQSLADSSVSIRGRFARSALCH
jgi:hypothetical protein